ncbi:hypothetical protein V1506DRAFT_538626 [Lipomyces tetrasporus]
MRLSAYNSHIDRRHSGRWPTQCRYPDCDSSKHYNDASAYGKHLQLAHGLNTRVKRVLYFPEKSVTKLKEAWKPAYCPVDNCTSKTKYTRKCRLDRHIVNVHGLNKKEASASAWVTTEE